MRGIAIKRKGTMKRLGAEVFCVVHDQFQGLNSAFHDGLIALAISCMKQTSITSKGDISSIFLPIRELTIPQMGYM